MNGIDEARSLLRLALRDFSALGGMGDTTVFADEIFGFHAQQAMEKTFKAWLAGIGVRFALTHDLSRLLDALEREGEDVEAFWNLAQYTIFAVQARHEEGMVESDDPLDRDRTLQEAMALIEHVSARLGLTA